MIDSILSEIPKLVCLIFAIIGLTDGIMPESFASTITPNVPVIVKPSWLANFLAFKSSIISKQSSSSTANAMALASPLSTETSIID